MIDNVLKPRVPRKTQVDRKIDAKLICLGQELGAGHTRIFLFRIFLKIKININMMAYFLV
jgi:hypothetical protein